MSSEEKSELAKDAVKTRERILVAARRAFARAGFAGTTVRAVAQLAAVSPNLITRYFGGKEGLFMAATDVQLGVDRWFDGPREALGQQLANAVVNRWTTMQGEDPLLALLRVAGERGEAAQTLANFLDEQSLTPLHRQLLSYGLEEADANARARAIDVFMLGLSMRHRLLREDLGESEVLKDWIAHTVQRLIDAP